MEITWGFVLFGILLLLLLSGVPVAFALGAVSVLGLGLVASGGPVLLRELGTTSWSAVASFVLTSVPLYIFMGAVMSQGGMGERLYDALSKVLRRLPGGLAVATTMACAVTAAISGSSVATAAAIGGTAVREMQKHGYQDDMATGCVAAGGTLGILIPPSIPMIIYGIIAKESIGKLFMAGVLPGIVLAFIFAVYQGLAFRRRAGTPAGSDPRPGGREILRALRDLLPPVVLILTVLGSIYLGVASPTEAAAVGCLMALAITAVIYRTLNIRTFLNMLRETARSTGMICFIIVGAMLFGYCLTVTGFAPAITKWVIGLSVPPWLMLLAFNLLFLFLGCFMETISIIVITLPIIAPIAQAYGWSLVWFAVIMTINMEMALITPPVGLNLYVVKGVAPAVSLSTIVRGVVPYIVLMVLMIAIVAVWPGLALWLPDHIR